MSQHFLRVLLSRHVLDFRGASTLPVIVCEVPQALGDTAEANGLGTLVRLNCPHCSGALLNVCLACICIDDPFVSPLVKDSVAALGLQTDVGCGVDLADQAVTTLGHWTPPAVPFDPLDGAMRQLVCSIGALRGASPLCESLVEELALRLPVRRHCEL